MAQMLAPNTTRICPLMSAEAGAARKATTLAMFLGSQTSKAPSSAPMPSAPNSVSVIRVRARGATAFDVTP